MKKLTFVVLSIFSILFANSFANTENSEENLPSPNTSSAISTPQCYLQKKCPKAPEDCYKHTLSFDSSYALSPYSNRAMSDFGVELFQFHGYLFNLIAQNAPFCDSRSMRTFLFFGSYFLSSGYLSHVYIVTYHEFGHYTRFKAEGIDAFFIGRPNHFFGLFFARLFDPFSGESTGWDGRHLTADQDIVISAGGINNEMRFSGDLGDQAYLSRGYIGDLYPYILGKTSTISYNGNDRVSILRGYAAKDYNISWTDLEGGNWVALLLSFTTYAYLNGIIDFIKCGKTTVNAYELYGIRLPDLESYTNRQGLSFKIKSGFRWDENLIFPVAFESIIEGESQSELTLGVFKRFPACKNLLLRANIVIGNEICTNIAVACPLKPRLMATVGLDYINKKTLYGERNITSTKASQNAATEIWAKISLLY